jgi:hypothetical protein
MPNDVTTGKSKGIDPKAILDEFTLATDANGKPLSRQRKYQLRMAYLGLCTKCGAPVDMESRYTRKGFVPWRPKQCKKCRDDNRIRQQYYRTYGGNVN